MKIAERLLDATIRGRNLKEGPLRAQLGHGKHLLAFLRHFG